METVCQTIEEYIAISRRNFFREWLMGIEDPQLAYIASTRIDRLRLGNFGDYKMIGNGLFELRIHYGSGHRIYFGRRGSKFVILLCGGDKRTQTWDIQLAKKMWAEYLERIK